MTYQEEMTSHPPESPQESPEACPLCGGGVGLAGTQSGYKKPVVFQIYHCERCLVAFPWPRKDASQLYDLIYRRAYEIPGYKRYTRYANQVLKAGDPLGLLAREDMYWAVERATKKVRGRILEVGCGLGYLTYALRKRGFDACGVDLSSVAVRNAVAAYGNYYTQGNVEEMAVTSPGAFDCVVLTEVIEHVLEPKKFLATITSLISPDGIIVLTTPNKSAYPPGSVWVSDCPPVHQWWFSEKSIDEMTKGLNLKAEFVDFTQFNRSYYDHLFNGYYWPMPVHARLTADDFTTEEAKTAEEQSVRLKFLISIGAIYPLRKMKALLKGNYCLSPRRPTMGVVLRHAASH